MDLREIWQKLLRGKRVILLTMLVGSALGYLVIKQLTPTYTASSSIMLETRQQQVVEAEAVLSGPVDRRRSHRRRDRDSVFA